jgi:hypothetical protein
MDIRRGKANCRCERPVPYVYSYIMDCNSFGAENHFYTTKTTPQIQKHIYVYLPSLLLSISMGEREIM